MECGPEPLLITACLQQRLNVTELHQPVWKQIVRLHSDRAVDQLRMLHCPLQRALLCRLFRFGQNVEQIPRRVALLTETQIGTINLHFPNRVRRQHQPGQCVLQQYRVDLCDLTTCPLPEIQLMDCKSREEVAPDSIGLQLRVQHTLCLRDSIPGNHVKDERTFQSQP